MKCFTFVNGSLTAKIDVNIMPHIGLAVALGDGKSMKIIKLHRFRQPCVLGTHIREATVSRERVPGVSQPYVTLAKPGEQKPGSFLLRINTLGKEGRHGQEGFADVKVGEPIVVLSSKSVVGNEDDEIFYSDYLVETNEGDVYTVTTTSGETFEVHIGADEPKIINSDIMVLRNALKQGHELYTLSIPTFTVSGAGSGSIQTGISIGDGDTGAVVDLGGHQVPVVGYRTNDPIRHGAIGKITVNGKARPIIVKWGKADEDGRIIVRIRDFGVDEKGNPLVALPVEGRPVLLGRSLYTENEITQQDSLWVMEQGQAVKIGVEGGVPELLVGNDCGKVAVVQWASYLQYKKEQEYDAQAAAILEAAKAKKAAQQQLAAPATKKTDQVTAITPTPVKTPSPSLKPAPVPQAADTTRQESLKNSKPQPKPEPKKEEVKEEKKVSAEGAEVISMTEKLKERFNRSRVDKNKKTNN